MSFKPYYRTPFTTRLLRIACVGGLCVGLTSSLQAQSFPAFNPEPADVNLQLEDSATPSSAKSAFPTQDIKTPSAEKPAARFPSANEEMPQVETPTNRFPVDTASFPTTKAEPAETASVGNAVTLEELGGLLSEMQLETSVVDRRHDFLYHADLEDQELELFFSVYLTEDDSQLRVRAWLDPLPESVISEEPLLKLLGRNTTLPVGMHYGYSAETRRFLLETGIANQGVEAERLNEVFNGVAREVADSWSLWSTSEWNNGAKRVATQPELDSRATQFSGDAFEMPIRR